MKLFKKESKQKKETRSLPMGKKSRSAFAVYAALVLMLCCCTTTAFAASDPLTVINNLSDFIFGLIRAIGMILLGFGVVQIGLSLKSHDPSQRANGFLTLAGGVVITFAKEILTLVCEGDFDPDYRLILITAVWGQARGGLPLTVAGKTSYKKSSGKRENI